MRFVLYFLIAISSLALQATIFSKLTIGGAKPDLLLIITVLFAFIKGARKGAAFGFAYGLLEDLVTGRFIGLNALVKTTVGFLVGLAEGKVYKENLIAPGLLIILASLVSGVLMLILFQIVGVPVNIKDSFWRTVVPMAVYNLGIAPLFYLKFFQSVTKGILSSYYRH